MELILWRHAEAEDGEPDHLRKLTSRGDKQARRVAEWLHAHLPDNARILVSPAVRAQQTARALAEVSGRKLRTVPQIGVGASVADVLGAVEWPSAKATVLVVGHQPTLGAVASFLVTGEESEWSVKKGGVWWLSSREREGVEKTLVRAVIGPDLA